MFCSPLSNLRQIKQILFPWFSRVSQLKFEANRSRDSGLWLDIQTNRDNNCVYGNLCHFFSRFQVDGPADSSDDDEKDEEDNDEDEDDDDDDDDDDLDPDGEDDDEGAEEEPLGSEDDISDEDATEIFETDNVVVCQYDKISRTR